MALGKLRFCTENLSVAAYKGYAVVVPRSANCNHCVSIAPRKQPADAEPYSREKAIGEVANKIGRQVINKLEGLDEKTTTFEQRAQGLRAEPDNMLTIKSVVGIL